MQEHSNKVLIVAIVCVIIGVVVGSVLMKGNTMGSLKGQALDSKYAMDAVRMQEECEPPMIPDPNQDGNCRLPTDIEKQALDCESPLVADTNGNCVFPTTSPDGRAFPGVAIPNPNDYMYACMSGSGEPYYATFSAPPAPQQQLTSSSGAVCNLMVGRSAKIKPTTSPVERQYSCSYPGGPAHIEEWDFSVSSYTSTTGGTTWTCIGL